MASSMARQGKDERCRRGDEGLGGLEGVLHCSVSQVAPEKNREGAVEQLCYVTGVGSVRVAIIGAVPASRPLAQESAWRRGSEAEFGIVRIVRPLHVE